MTTTHTNLALVEGELYIYNHLKLINVRTGRIDDFEPRIGKHNPELIFFGDLAYPIIATTASIATIPKLDCKHFVKPKVDVHLEAVNKYWENRPITECDYLDDFVKGFKSGYNAKEAEFTDRDLIDAMYSVAEYPNKKTHEETFSEFVKSYLKKLRLLSLPKSVTLNENNEVIEVTWD